MMPGRRSFAARMWSGRIGAVTLVAVALAWAAVLQAQSPVVRSGSAAISGVVTAAGTAEPLPGVIVELLQPGSNRAMLTDEKGRFVFTGLRAGSYVLHAIKAGFADGYYSPAVMGTIGGSVVVADDDWYADATIEMARLASLEGTVLGEDGTPVPLVYVWLLAQVRVSGVQRWAAGPVTRTDDRGVYRFANLAPGRYVVTLPFVQHSIPSSSSVAALEGVGADQLAALDEQSIRRGGEPTRRVSKAIVRGMTAVAVGHQPALPHRPDGRPQAYPTVFYPGVRSISEAEPIELTADSDRLGVDMTIRPVLASRVSGRVTTPSSQYQGMVLRLVPSGLEELGPGSAVATTLVLPDGSFTFLNVPAGSYTLIAPGSTSGLDIRVPAMQVGVRPTKLPEVPGIGRQGSGSAAGLVAAAPNVTYNAWTPQTLTDAHAGWIQTPIEVGDSDIDRLAVELVPSGSVRIRIVYEGMSGTPPTGTIELTPADGNPTLGVHTVFVDRNSLSGSGSQAMSIPVVRPGRYALRTIGMSGVTIKSILVDGIDCSRDPLVISSGLESRVVVTMTGEAISVGGFVIDDRGGHVPRASVIAFPTDSHLWSNYGFTPTWIRVSTGSSNGAFQLSNLRAGEYYLIGVDPANVNAWADPAFLAAAARHAPRHSLKWGERRTVDVPMMVPAK